MQQARRTLRSRGIAITVMLGVITLLVICVMTLGTVTVQTLGVANSMTVDKQAWYVAEAGVRDAVRALKSDQTWATGYTDKALVTNTGHTYTVTVTNNITGVAPVTAPDGTSVPTGFAYVISYGTTATGETKTVSAMTHQESIFQTAVFGDKFVEYGGNGIVDAWDSQGGTTKYSPGARVDDGTTLVGTNGTQDGAIQGFGNAMVYGGVSSGPGSNPETAIDADGNYTGTASANAGIPMPPVIPPGGSGPNLKNVSGTITPGTYGSLSTNASITLTTGTYYFTGDVKIGGNAKLSISNTGGPVIVYVGGSWDTTGCTIINTAQTPWDFQLYGTDDCESIKLSGGNQTQLVCYAPEAEVVFRGTADFYGSIVAKSIDMSGGGSAHYDLDLANRGIGPTYWEIVAFHRW